MEKIYVSNLARLKLPTGAEWEVELTRYNGKVWIEKGWPEFSKFCSQDYGDFLIFRYERNSIFQVCIFDRTATEIDYPIAMPEMEETDEDDDEEEEEEDDDDISIEILEDLPSRRKTREKSPLPCPPSYKKIRTSWSTGKAADSMSRNDGGGSSPSRKCPDVGEMRSLNTNYEKARAHLLSADAFISEEAHHFKVVMQPSYVQQSYLAVPAAFLKRNLLKDAANVILRVSNGKTWSVKFKCEKSRASLQLGWLAFVKDNCLKVGDVCVFVLLEDTKLSFQVEIFKAKSFPEMPAVAGHGRGATVQVQDNGSSTIKVKSDCSINCGKKRRSETIGKAGERRCSSVNLEAADKFIPNNPFFKVSISTYHIIKSKVHVPASFIKSCIKKLEKQTVMLQVKNRLWPVNLVPHPKLSGKLCGGWIAFAREHNLKEGDVCVFELMDKIASDIVLRVHIFKCDE